MQCSLDMGFLEKVSRRNIEFVCTNFCFFKSSLFFVQIIQHLQKETLKRVEKGRVWSPRLTQSRLFFLGASNAASSRFFHTRKRIPEKQKRHKLSKLQGRNSFLRSLTSVDS